MEKILILLLTIFVASIFYKSSKDKFYSFLFIAITMLHSYIINEIYSLKILYIMVSSWIICTIVIYLMFRKYKKVKK